MENNQELEKELEEAVEETVEAEEVTEEVSETEETVEEAVEETAETTEETVEESTEKKGFFGKKKDKKDKKDQKIEELEDKVKRQLAEFENFRNRTEKEKSRMYEFGARDVIEKMLPVVDNFERGLASIPEEEKGGPVASGMEMIYKQMMTTLEGLGVTPIDALNKPFDPNFHNAVMHVEDEEVEESTVVEEFQKGYIYKEHVIRYSMVKVAN
ncbi:MAG: nucleotide exchange factor GrpE [Lachnospiraceae bacterium]|nr:nucleotide exchange factor GrpE [Lachnospiraceae bacterium]MEE1015441.1 nucleotide exchange factor GrpE [Lachnospiraceae bacterium]